MTVLPNELSVVGISQLLADDTHEIVRMWVTNHGGSTIVVNAGVLPEPFVYGVLLADAVRHGARAYAAHNHGDETAILTAIKAGLDADLALPDAEMITISRGGSVN